MSVRPPKLLAPKTMPALVTTLDAEIVAEKAATLGRLTHAFETALAAFRAHEAEAETEAGAGEGSAGAKREERRAALLDRAAEALFAFVVQREACGMRNTEAVLRHYEVPAAIRLRMGVARRR